MGYKIRITLITKKPYRPQKHPQVKIQNNKNLTEKALHLNYPHYRNGATVQRCNGELMRDHMVNNKTFE